MDKLKVKKQLLNQFLFELTARDADKLAGKKIQPTAVQQSTQTNKLKDMSEMYVEACHDMHNIKTSVKAATTAPIKLSGVQEKVDGITIKSGDRILVKDQDQSADNGIYISSDGDWARSTDTNSAQLIGSNIFTYVEEGVTNGGTGYINMSPRVIDLGKTPLKFTVYKERANNAGNIRTGIQMSTNDPQEFGEF